MYTNQINEIFSHFGNKNNKDMKTIMNHSMIDPREPGTFTPVYQCPQCGQEYTDPDQLRWYTFTDGERRKQCYMCYFHPDEDIEKIEVIDELDFQNY